MDNGEEGWLYVTVDWEQERNVTNLPEASPTQTEAHWYQTYTHLGKLTHTPQGLTNMEG